MPHVLEKQGAPAMRPPISGPATASLIQPYRILTGGKILPLMPASKPWNGYPYAVVTGAQFPAQALGAHAVPNDFLPAQGGAVANVVNHPGGFSLRVSDDSKIAIEDSDLVQRQPKTFYATQDVVNSANLELTRVRSRFRLQPGGQSITMLTGWYGSNSLVAVAPLYNNGNPDQAPQNCNAIAARILGLGSDALTHGASSLGEESAQRIGGISAERWLALLQARHIPNKDLEDHLAARYVNHRDNRVVRARQANQYARPEVGDSFMTKTVGHAEDVGNGRSRVTDLASGQARVLGWNYHFGGVVARSGSDRITLENYARGDNRQENADPRWYFQMYGENHGQSYHEFYSPKADYSNPVTVAYTNPNRPAPEPWWETLLDIINSG